MYAVSFVDRNGRSSFLADEGGNVVTVDDAVKARAIAVKVNLNKWVGDAHLDVRVTPVRYDYDECGPRVSAFSEGDSNAG